MKLRCVFTALALAMMAAGARAQGGLYFNPIVTHVSISQPDSGPFAFLGQATTSRIFGGLSIGGYYDLLHEPKFTLGVDVRDEIEHGNSALLNSFLVGARLSAKMSRPALKPYVQLSGGAGTTKSPLNPVHASKAVFKAYAGLDIALNRHVDLRALELGYGSVKTISSSLYGSQLNIPSANLFSISTGFVFRIP